MLGPAVTADVRQRFRDDEVGGRLDLLRRPLARSGAERDGHGRARGEGGERRVEAAIGEHGGMDSAGQVADLDQRLLRLLVGAAHELGRLLLRAALLEPPSRTAEVDRQRDQSRLGAVVEVALDLAAIPVAEATARSRCSALCAAARSSSRRVGPSRARMRSTSKAVRARMIHGVRKTSRRPPPTTASHSQGSSITVPNTSPRFSGGIQKYHVGAVTDVSATDQSTTVAMNRVRPTGKAKMSR